MFVGGTGTVVTRFRARPEEAHAVMCAVLSRARALGFLTRRLGRGVHLCDADAALLLLTLAPPVNEPSDTYLLSGTVTGSTPCELTRTLFSLVEDISFTPLELEDLRESLPSLPGVDDTPLMIVSHLTTDLVAQVEKAVELGAAATAITVLHEDERPHRRVEAHLRSRGVTVARPLEAMAAHRPEPTSRPL
ncbi:hypothetical protein [Lentzea sp. NPDC004782]|uniref:hypothetical protein n=1 Tax=Lentzea sp. NPDC004782 TaxID=3154458 RepID=UPI0033B65511